VLREVFKLKQAGKVREAGALMSWLAASENVASSEKKAAGIKGDITSTDAMAYLQGILEIVNREVWVLDKNVFGFFSVGQHLQHDVHGHPRPGENWLAAARLRVNRNPAR
jgi:hypothetical protein